MPHTIFSRLQLSQHANHRWTNYR